MNFLQRVMQRSPHILNGRLMVVKALHITATTAKNHYEILGVSKSASASQIKQAYFRLCKEYHPDKHSGDDIKSKKFIQINDAYTVLSNNHSRREYDANLFNSPQYSHNKYSSAYRHNPYSYQETTRQRWEDYYSHRPKYEYRKPEDPLGMYWDRYYKNQKTRRRRYPYQTNYPNAYPLPPTKYVRLFLFFLFCFMISRYMAQWQMRQYRSVIDEIEENRHQDVKKGLQQRYEGYKQYKNTLETNTDGLPVSESKLEDA